MDGIEGGTPMPEVRKQFGKSHTIADCLDCNWRSENYKNGQALAAIHAKKYRHKVSVDVGITGFYDGRGQEAQK